MAANVALNAKADSLPNESVTYTATVTRATTYGPVSGTVDLVEGTTVLASASLANGVATIQYGGLTTGAHTLCAVYRGDNYHLENQSESFTATVARAQTTTTLSTTSGIVATVVSRAPHTAIPSGALFFTVNGNALADVPLSPVGTAQLNPSLFPAESTPSRQPSSRTRALLGRYRRKPRSR